MVILKNHHGGYSSPLPKLLARPDVRNFAKPVN